jgi:hypothetical protein
MARVTLAGLMVRLVTMLAASGGCSSTSPAPPGPATPLPPPARPLALRVLSVEGPTVRLEARNDGTFPIRLPSTLEPYLVVDRFDRAGTPTPCVPAPFPARVSWVDLEPGGTMELDVDVAARCRFGAPPERVAVAIDVPPGADAARDAPNAWTGRSDQVVVELRPR